MSEEAEDLLVRGTAAARAGSREEARFHLEWALNTDADADQRAEAWYWLSRIAADPAERRRCLEQVLATVANYPEARRDLAILDGRLDPAALLDPRRPVAPHTPAPLVDPAAVERSRCAACGGALSHDPAAGGLRCQFCGGRSATPPGGAAGAVEEQDWIAAIYTARGHRWEIPTTRVFGCAGCGARQLLPPGRASASCPFCGSAEIVVGAAGDAPIAPEGLAPFAFDEAAARRHAHAWLAARRFHPRDLDGAAAFDAPAPVYVPFWTFDLAGDLPWRGTVEGRWGNGQPRVPTDGVEPLIADDILVPASDSLPADLLRALAFDTRDLVPYAPDLLAGWPAELYRIPPADASLQAREQTLLAARAVVLDRAAREVHDLRLDPASLRVLSYKLVLLPVWTAGYRYHDRRYRLLLNGRTGAGAGEIPRGPVGGFLARLAGEES